MYLAKKLPEQTVDAGPKRYRCAWAVHATGFSGHGDWFESRATVEAWVKHLNSDLPELHHWVEESPCLPAAPS